MKKFLIAIILMCIIMSNRNFNNNFSFLNFFEGDYYAITSSKVDENSVLKNNVYITNAKVQVDKLVGECIVLSNYNLDDVLAKLKAKIITKTFLETGSLHYTAFSNYLLINKNCAFNFEILEAENLLILGWPKIMDI